MKVAVLAVDGGNSKTDVALVSETGALLAFVTGPTVSHQAVGLAAGGQRLEQLVMQAQNEAGLGAVSGRASVGVYCLAGADFPSDVRRLRREIATHGLAADELVLNDTFAALRAGALGGWGIALICGQGINAAGVAPDGRTARFAGIGALSGDWGGGQALGQAALAAAIRARDGRSPRTSLERAVAEHFGRRTPEAVMFAMYQERIPSTRLSELAPVVFGEAEAGDAVARSIVDHLADELIAMAGALIRRLRLGRQAVDVVMAGGVFRATDHRFYTRLRDGIGRFAPRARLVRLALPPVAGAALIGLDRLSPTGEVGHDEAERLRAGFRRKGLADRSST